MASLYFMGSVNRWGCRSSSTSPAGSTLLDDRALGGLVGLEGVYEEGVSDTQGKTTAEKSRQLDLTLLKRRLLVKSSIMSACAANEVNPRIDNREITRNLRQHMVFRPLPLKNRKRTTSIPYVLYRPPDGVPLVIFKLLALRDMPVTSHFCNAGPTNSGARSPRRETPGRPWQNRRVLAALLRHAAVLTGNRRKGCSALLNPAPLPLKLTLYA